MSMFFVTKTFFLSFYETKIELSGPIKRASESFQPQGMWVTESFRFLACLMLSLDTRGLCSIDWIEITLQSLQLYT